VITNLLTEATSSDNVQVSTKYMQPTFRYMKVYILTVQKVKLSVQTRSSATADGPRDAMYQSKSCRLLHNSVGTTCTGTTSPEQIEVMELYYSHTNV